MKLLKILGPMLTALILAAPVQAAQTAADGKGDMVKLGKITPNGPYRFWAAINKVLPDYAAVTGGAELHAQVKTLSAHPAAGRTPGDVMVQTAEFRDLLEILRRRLKLAKIEIYKDPLGRAVTPGVVLANAGFNMDALVETYRAAAKKPEESLGHFYDVPVMNGKSPSDVYGLVELATRRLRLIQGS
ncbi:MAG: hypothetical protein HN478_08195 [Rhodospirillaceae bacterium]|jgi:hypothetical protein|nr:hypothetical protein [Rhodospirillaceae bacterium]MBT4487592.1 hypothetical protein [Rhodospirillaceae bacterium]MBT5194246.1 hypothetical protein [Rhodospirillaceae bacterium]MBT5895954.1 hypothetical protein [Rhodospirillaceae bacterium]MBT6428234.1 hypothetical protein [Rhodospirillaceae bacterium]